MSKTTKIIMIVVVILVIAAVGYFMWKNSQKPTVASTGTSTGAPTDPTLTTGVATDPSFIS